MYYFFLYSNTRNIMYWLWPINIISTLLIFEYPEAPNIIARLFSATGIPVHHFFTFQWKKLKIALQVRNIFGALKSIMESDMPWQLVNHDSSFGHPYLEAKIRVPMNSTPPPRGASHIRDHETRGWLLHVVRQLISFSSADWFSDHELWTFAGRRESLFPHAAQVFGWRCRCSAVGRDLG